MKIVYLHQYFVTPTMAGATRSYEMARRLVRAGHEVHMVTADPAGRRGWRKTVEAGIHVHWAGVPYNNHMSMPRRMLAFLHFALLATLRATRLGGDVIFATSTPLTIAVPAVLAAALRRRPFVFEVRDMWPDVPIALGVLKNPVLKFLARRLELFSYTRARSIVALAPGMAEDIIAKGIPAEKLVVIPNGCDLDLFGGDLPAPSPRDLLPYLGARKLVVYTGMIGRVNGVGYLIEVAAAARQLDADVRFVIVGGGAELDRVKRLAAQHGVLNQTVFFFDPLPKTEIVTWVKAADMLVALITGPRVVWKDAVQNKFFDALAAGKPIVSNFRGWQSEIAEREGVGFILDPSDPTGAAQTLIKALYDPAWLAQAARRALTLAHGDFNRDKHAGRLEQVLREAAGVRFRGAAEVRSAATLLSER